MVRRPNPLTVRLSENEKQTLSKVARQLKTSRNALVRTACFSFVDELAKDKVIETVS